ncbi:MAG TPA: hypothetical protein VF242_08890 [Nitrososphaeraceae archaeon]
MLKDIITVQPYSSSYYETIKLVMQQQQTSTTNEISNNNNFESQYFSENLSRHQLKMMNLILKKNMIPTENFKFF